MPAFATSRMVHQVSLAKLLAAVGGAVVIGGLNAPAIQAQSPSTRPPAVEVATVKLNTSGGQRGMRMNPGRFTVSSTPLRTLIRNAYKVPDFTISGGPGWINSEPYDIEAKVEGQIKGDDAFLLLQTLLTERFQLKVHHETREGPVYLLTVAKGGPRLSLSNCVVVDPTHPPVPLSGDKLPEVCGLNKGGGGGPSRMLNMVGLRMDEPNGNGATVPGLTFYFASILERTVVDKTGLTGRFDIYLEYTPESSATPPADDAAPSIFTAVQEQLGLKLESGKGPVDLLVIDHVERPSEN
jgi:uncharacterized protein (TIGR03435 family)